MKSGVDPNVIDKACKPCDDFWRYASGAWMDANPIPPSQSSWGPMAAINDQNRERLKVILDTAAMAKAAKGTNDQKLGDLYGACMDEERAEKLGWQPLAKDLDAIAKVANAKELARLLEARQKENPIGPFAVAASPNVKNTEETIVGVVPTGLSLPERDFYFKSDERTVKVREEFLGYAARILTLGGSSEGAEEAKKILALETKMAEPMLTNVARRDPYASYHPVGLKGLSELTPSVNWQGILTSLGIPEGTMVNVSQPEYMKALEKLMAETPIDTWKLWLRWKTLSGAAQYLSKAFVDESFRFNSTVLNGVREQQPRWKRCVNLVDGSLGDALGEKYVAKHFPPAAKAKMMAMVENIRATLKEELEAAEWLSPETRAAAVKKLASFRPKIGYADRWRDYSPVTIDRGDLIASLRSAGSANRRHVLAKVGKPRDRNDWGMTPPTVNAYYSPTQNEIAFPAGILQAPLFDMDADDAANYGAAGAVIGHEMGHGFDDQGSKFDADGNLKNWWTDADRKNFDERAACFVEQFNTLDVGPGLRHNGKLVLGEAMGDLGGLKLAHKAYRRSLRGKPEPAPMDGFTGDQRFFLAFARVWGTQLREQAVRLRLATDPHPIAKWRAIGTLQNMPEFHKAFGCKEGDFMVRPAARQCKLW